MTNTYEEISQMDKLRLLRFFLTVIDHGSFSAAAQQLAISPSTISKAIQRLEQSVGIQLFQRNTRHLRLTTEGEQYGLQIRSLLEQLDTCDENIKQRNDVPRGKLRISVPISYGRLYVRPLLKSFNQLYPDICIELSYDDRYVDIIEQGFDVCIRSGTVSDSRLVSRQLSPIDFLICASPAYVKHHSMPKSARDFKQHPWIRFRYQQTGRLMPIMMPGRASYREFDPDQTYIVDDGEALVELCADGLGLTQMPHFIARNGLLDKRVVTLFPAFHPSGFGVFVLYPKRNYLPERVKAFVDFLCQQIEKLGETPRSTWARVI